MHVVVSGAACYLAQSLVPVLCADRAVARVTAVDREQVGLRHPKLRTVLADIDSATAAGVLRGADALVHLDFLALRNRAMAGADVAGTRGLLAAADEVGVTRIVFMSSAAVYGAGTNLTEDAMLQPLPGFLFAQRKVECEQWLEAQLPHVIRLRPHVILGPHAPPFVKSLVGALAYPKLPEPVPLLQCVHELDVSNAIALALHSNAGGAYNLAAPQPFSLHELVKWRHPRGIGLPPWVFCAAVRLALRVGGWGGGPGWHEALAATLTLDCERAARELGWCPGYPEWRSVVAATFAPY